MGLIVISPPTDDPITLEEAKAHLRVTHIYEDDYILSLIRAATTTIEDHTDRRLITQTLEYTRDELERPLLLGSTTLTGTRPIILPVAPIQSILTFSYLDADSVTNYLYDSVGSPENTTGVVVDLRSTPARILPLSGGTWPTPLTQGNSVAVRLIAGYGDSGESVPSSLKHAIMLLAGHWFQHRSSVGDDKMMEIPHGIEWIINPYKLHVFA